MAKVFFCACALALLSGAVATADASADASADAEAGKLFVQPGQQPQDPAQDRQNPVADFVVSSRLSLL